MDPHIFEITEGYFGLALVDTAASGQDAWQSPAGDEGTGVATTPIVATIADYEAAAASGWTCQVTSAAITTRPSTRTVQRKATFCAPGAQIPTPDESQFTLAANIYQDADVVDSLSLWLFDHDTEEAFVYLGMNLDEPPTAVGRVRVAAGNIGGDARTPLEATLSLPFTVKPLIEPVTA